MRDFRYDRYFRIVTVPGIKDGTAGVGIEEYRDAKILYFASLYIEDGGRSQAVKRAIKEIQTQIKPDERVAIRLNGSRWRIWRGLYTEYNITNLKKNRAGWCGILAEDAVRRQTNITERMEN